MIRSTLDTHEFERLYAAHAKPLLAFLAYRTGDRALSEDLVADTFERVLRTRRPFDPRRGSRKTWLYTIALNVLRDHLRRSAAHERTIDRAFAGVGHAVGPRDLEAIEERDALHRALASLTAEEQEAVALRYGADLTVNEIAKVTHEKPTTIHGRVYRALSKLKATLE